MARNGPASQSGLPKVVLVGSPNVGKSVLFNALTGGYTVVSNYPGTTVEVTRSRMQIGRHVFQVMDTPGMYSMCPITLEERVARRILIEERPEVVVHVVDAKNLARMLGLTLQMMEAGLPVVLAVNMSDEADELGIRIDTRKLETELGIPVIGASARGIAAPKGTPPEIIKIIEAAFEKAVKDPEHIKKMNNVGLPIRFMGTEEYQKFIKTEYEKIKVLLPVAMKAQ